MPLIRCPDAPLSPRPGATGIALPARAMEKAFCSELINIYNVPVRHGSDSEQNSAERSNAQKGGRRPFGSVGLRLWLGVKVRKTPKGSHLPARNESK